MTNHKEGCKWEGTYISVYSANPDDDDESLTVDEDGIRHIPAVFSGKEEDIICINFYYCPICGCEL